MSGTQSGTFVDALLAHLLGPQQQQPNWTANLRQVRPTDPTADPNMADRNIGVDESKLKAVDPSMPNAWAGPNSFPPGGDPNSYEDIVAHLSGANQSPVFLAALQHMAQQGAPVPQAVQAQVPQGAPMSSMIGAQATPQPVPITPGSPGYILQDQLNDLNKQWPGVGWTRTPTHWIPGVPMS